MISDEGSDSDIDIQVRKSMKRADKMLKEIRVSSESTIFTVFCLCHRMKPNLVKRAELIFHIISDRDHDKVLTLRLL